MPSPDELWNWVQNGNVPALRESLKNLSKSEVEKLFSHRDQETQQTILHVASATGTHETVDLLIPFPESSNIVNSQDKFGWTPLHCACHAGNLKACRTLLAHPKIDPTIVTQNKSTALHYIGNYENKLKNEELELTESVRNSPSRPRRFTNGSMMAHWIQKLERGIESYTSKSLASEIIDTLLERGVDINSLNSSNETPMHSACLRGNKETVMLLLAKGAYLFQLNSRGLSCLEYAQKSGNTEIVEVLEGFLHFFAVWLPDEILLEIFYHLSGEDILRAGCVCRKFQRVANDQRLWQYQLATI